MSDYQHSGDGDEKKQRGYIENLGYQIFNAGRNTILGVATSESPLNKALSVLQLPVGLFKGILGIQDNDD